MRSPAPALALLLAFLPLSSGGSDPTLCGGDGTGLAVVAAAGVLASGGSDGHPVDDAEDASVIVWPQAAPDSHGSFTWTLRDRATGGVFASGGAVEVPTPRFAGVSPYDDLCLEVENDQGQPVEYVVVVTLQR